MTAEPLVLPQARRHCAPEGGHQSPTPPRAAPPRLLRGPSRPTVGGGGSSTACIGLNRDGCATNTARLAVTPKCSCWEAASVSLLPLSFMSRCHISRAPTVNRLLAQIVAPDSSSHPIVVCSLCSPTRCSPSSCRGTIFGLRMQLQQRTQLPVHQPLLASTFKASGNQYTPAHPGFSRTAEMFRAM